MDWLRCTVGLSRLLGGSAALKSSGADPSPRIRSMVRNRTSCSVQDGAFMRIEIGDPG
jgi:hypothetical protein